ncbi:MAG: glycosyltransferase, partial [Candidatus Pacebacteria bacterium]|nr:glycosyltransferase [Candidatus Paceibacterota bacterium]
NIKCLIIGEGPEKASLQQEIERKGLNNKVILTGFKTDIISYINALDIFLLTSEREGFSRVVIEAMLMGKPVIAPRIVGPSELVIENETGFLFKTGNVVELADYIFKLTSSHAMRKKMGEAGKKRVINNFSIEKYVSQVSAVFSDLTASS